MADSFKLTILENSFKLETNDSPKFPLVQALNNPINIFLINSNIVLYYNCFIKYLWISKISLVSAGL